MGFINGIRRRAPWTERSVTISGFIILIYGLFTTNVFVQLDSQTVRHNLIIAGLILVSGGIISRICRIRLASGIAVTAMLLLARVLGVTAIVAALLMLAASLVIGERIQRRNGSLGYVISVMCGIAMLTGVVGWLLPFHVHGFLIYASTLGAISFSGRQQIFRALDHARTHWTLGVSAAPRQAAFSMLIITVASLALLLPTIQFDDVAYHMLLPTQLLSLGRYKMDVASQGWALAPWASDILQGYIAVLSGCLKSSAANACWFALALGGLWQLGRVIGLHAGLRWFSLAAYASVPLLTALNASMQADNAITTATIALVVIAAKGMRYRKNNAIYPFIIISGLLIALKATQILLILPFALVLLVTYKPGRFIRLMLSSLPIGLLVCGSSYFYAWYVTGNPVFPIFNGIFKSPFGPATNFDDQRWHQGLHWDTIWQITFHTDKFQEAYPGAFGFILLAFLGAVLMSLTRARLRWISLPLLLCMSGIFVGIQYARYILPSMMPLFPIALVIWQGMNFQRIGNLILASLVSLNVVFIPSCSYIFNGDIIWQIMRGMNGLQDSVQLKAYKQFVPEVLIQNYLFSHYGDSYFLYLADIKRPFLGPFEGRAVTSVWYDSTFASAAAKANEDSSGENWIRLFARTGIDHVLTFDDPGVPLGNALIRLHAFKEYSVGQAQLWRVCNVDCEADVFPLLESRDIGGKMNEQPLLVVRKYIDLRGK
ncbi:hypothetical protein [Dyella nitratireducens]|nr:hypothetical protein [Dyella nitratireducens]